MEEDSQPSTSCSCSHLLSLYVRFWTRTENSHNSAFMKSETRVDRSCSGLSLPYRIDISWSGGQDCRQRESTRRAIRKSLIPYSCCSCLGSNSKEVHGSTSCASVEPDSLIIAKAGPASPSQADPGTRVLFRNCYWAIGCLNNSFHIQSNLKEID